MEKMNNQEAARRKALIYFEIEHDVVTLTNDDGHSFTCHNNERSEGLIDFISLSELQPEPTELLNSFCTAPRGSYPATEPKPVNKTDEELLIKNYQRIVDKCKEATYGNYAIALCEISGIARRCIEYFNKHSDGK